MLVLTLMHRQHSDCVSLLCLAIRYHILLAKLDAEWFLRLVERENETNQNNFSVSFKMPSGRRLLVA